MNIEQVQVLSVKDIDELSEAFIRVVQGGASLGFLRDVSKEDVLTYWQGVGEQLGPTLFLLIARDGDQILGSVQLERCMKPNGSHRAEVLKLFVLPEGRRKGIASGLMERLELLAVEHGVRLLVLDTQSGSGAEGLYQHLGWVKSGEIPNFALSPDGELFGTSYYYKELSS